MCSSQLADVSDKPKEFTDLYKSIVKSDDSAKVPTIIGETPELLQIRLRIPSAVLLFSWRQPAECQLQ